MNKVSEARNEKIFRKAMVFAAGLGTRMQPITKTIPKPLVKVCGKTLIDYNLDRLARLGVEAAVVNVHYLADQIEQHVSRRNAPKIKISDERNELLDTGGGFLKALPFLGDNPVYILNSDNVWVDRYNSNLVNLSTMWDANKMDGLLMLASSNQNYGYFGTGDFVLAESGKLTRRNKQDSTALIYTGVGIINPRIVGGFNLKKFSLNEIFDLLIGKGRLFGMKMTGHWYHIGTPEVIKKVEDEIYENVEFCKEENL